MKISGPGAHTILNTPLFTWLERYLIKKYVRENIPHFSRKIVFFYTFGHGGPHDRTLYQRIVPDTTDICTITLI